MRVATAPHVRMRQSFEQLACYEPPDSTILDAVRLDCNEAPDGPLPAAREALARHIADVNRYPQRDGELIERLAQRHGVASESIALGNGIDGIIGYLSDAYLDPGDEIVTAWPSFPTYVTEAHKRGATIKLAPLRGGAVDVEAIAELISSRTKLIWVCTPNNPTGVPVTRMAITRLLDAVPESVLVIVDEAYFEYAGGSGQIDAVAEFVGGRPNVAAVRTFSKIYGLASLRVGYLIGPTPVTAAVGRARRYYDITELGNIAALACLDDSGDREIARRRVENQRTRQRLGRGLQALGLDVLPSETNFVAANVRDADAVAGRLLAHGVATRSLSGLGAAELLRITVGAPAEVERLLELLPGTLPGAILHQD